MTLVTVAGSVTIVHSRLTTPRWSVRDHRRRGPHERFEEREDFAFSVRVQPEDRREVEPGGAVELSSRSSFGPGHRLLVREDFPLPEGLQTHARQEPAAGERLLFDGVLLFVHVQPARRCPGGSRSPRPTRGACCPPGCTCCSARRRRLRRASVRAESRCTGCRS